MWHLISEKILAELLGYLTASNPWNHVVDEATNRTWQQALEKELTHRSLPFINGMVHASIERLAKRRKLSGFWLEPGSSKDTWRTHATYPDRLERYRRNPLADSAEMNTRFCLNRSQSVLTIPKSCLSLLYPRAGRVILFWSLEGLLPDRVFESGEKG